MKAASSMTTAMATPSFLTALSAMPSFGTMQTIEVRQAGDEDRPPQTEAPLRGLAMPDQMELRQGALPIGGILVDERGTVGSL
ncbi:hypothetical protein DXT94_15620 [Rhizobium sp. ICMP 5592]|nr:hypothetical protein [Rhizobium sp. ICMP 5592]